MTSYYVADQSLMAPAILPSWPTSRWPEDGSRRSVSLAGPAVRFEREEDALTTAPMTRPLGRGGIDVSALGLGCWAMGGQIIQDGLVHGFGHTDDERSLRGIRRALDLGVSFFTRLTSVAAATASACWSGRSAPIDRTSSSRRSSATSSTKIGGRSKAPMPARPTSDGPARRAYGGLGPTTSISTSYT